MPGGAAEGVSGAWDAWDVRKVADGTYDLAGDLAHDLASDLADPGGRPGGQLRVRPRPTSRRSTRPRKAPRRRAARLRSRAPIRRRPPRPTIQAGHPATSSSADSAGSSAARAWWSAVGERLGDRVVVALGARVEVAGRLHRAAGAAVAHHQERDALRPGGEHRARRAAASAAPTTPNASRGGCRRAVAQEPGRDEVRRRHLGVLRVVRVVRVVRVPRVLGARPLGPAAVDGAGPRRSGGNSPLTAPARPAMVRPRPAPPARPRTAGPPPRRTRRAERRAAARRPGRARAPGAGVGGRRPLRSTPRQRRPAGGAARDDPSSQPSPSS